MHEKAPKDLKAPKAPKALKDLKAPKAPKALRRCMNESKVCAVRVQAAALCVLYIFFVVG